MAAEDPEAALRALAELRQELETFVSVQVERGLTEGRSFAALARAMGISRQAAHRRFRVLAPEPARDRAPRLVATDAARRVVRLARAEALAAGAALRSEHLLLAILRTDSPVAGVLRSEGLTLADTRACIERSRHGAGDDGSDCLRQIGQQAARVALARGSTELDLDHLLLAVLAAPDGGARRTITALGLEPASVQARLGRHEELTLR